MLPAIFRRIRSDFSLRDSSQEYEAVLRAAVNCGYRIVTLKQLYDLMSSNTLRDRTLAIRHDVDLNLVSGNEKFHKLEKDCGAVSTFYFRLKTFRSHLRFIDRLAADGFEIGYHFEEPAAFAIKHGIADKAELIKAKSTIQEEFRKNIEKVRQRYYEPIKSICSHGAWINEKLGIPNQAFVDRELMDECGLLFEAYGPPVKTTATVYISDVTSGNDRWAENISPQEVFAAGLNPVYLLAHESLWFSGIVAKNRQLASRISEGMRYTLLKSIHSRSASH